MGVDKAPSTPLPTPLPSRKPPHPEQAATGADLPAPNTAPWRPTVGGGHSIPPPWQEVGCQGGGGGGGAQWRALGTHPRVDTGSWGPLMSSRCAAHRPPPRLPAVLVTKTENLVWANGPRQEPNRQRPVGPEEPTWGAEGGGQNTSAACAGGGILVRLQGLGTFRELCELSNTTASGQVKGERQPGALTAASGTTTCRSLQVEGGTFKRIRSRPKGRGRRTVRAGHDRRARGASPTHRDGHPRSGTSQSPRARR